MLLFDMTQLAEKHYFSGRLSFSLCPCHAWLGSGGFPVEQLRPNLIKGLCFLALSYKDDTHLGDVTVALFPALSVD